MQNNSMTIGLDMASDAKFYADYSRWDEKLLKYETWEMSVTRVMNMHRERYKDVMSPELKNYIDMAEVEYLDKGVLGAQRALQFGGEQIFKLSRSYVFIVVWMWCWFLSTETSHG